MLSDDFVKSLLFLLVASLKSSAADEVSIPAEYTKDVGIEELILCRNCGTTAADAHFLFDRLSPEASYSYNETLFGQDRVLVQLIPSSHSQFGITFQFVTLSQARCVPIGKHEWADTWYEGYSWRPCMCGHCGVQLGWYFVPADASASTLEPFYGVTLPQLVGERFIDSLLVTPAVKTDDSD